MLLNPYAKTATVIPGTRVLEDQLNLTGVQFEDPKQQGRSWYITTLYAPLPGRALGGIRARAADNKGFVSFVNQRDLELLMEVARPGDWCTWLGAHYPGINDDIEGWVGLGMDNDDLSDDLFERELCIRAQQPGQVLPSFELTRFIHLESGSDHEQVDILLWDADPDTGMGPDTRLETINRRWRKSERCRVMWDRF